MRKNRKDECYQVVGGGVGLKWLWKVNLGVVGLLNGILRVIVLSLYSIRNCGSHEFLQNHAEWWLFCRFPSTHMKKSLGDISNSKKIRMCLHALR